MKRAANGTGHRWLVEHATHKGEECLVWPFACSTPGYGAFSIGKTRLAAHRFMCELAHGTPPSAEYEAAHSCGNRRCVNPEHLSWKTRQDNQFDRTRHGTQTVAGRQKISHRQVEQIRQLKGIETSIATAARYGITESNVRLIQEGKTWRTEGRKHAMLLRPEQVIAIRKAATSKSDYQIAKEMGLKRSSVRRVRVGVTYRHIPN
jgi:hypothetical protein